MQNPKTAIDIADAEGRKAGRLRCDGVQTAFGAIANLSAKGACIKSAKVGKLRPGMIVTIDLHTDFGNAPIRAKVVRVTKKGWRKHEAGLEFLETSEWARALLGQIAYASPAEAHQLYHSMRRAG